MSYGAFFGSQSNKEDIVGRGAQVLVEFGHRLGRQFFGQRRLPLGVAVEADDHERDVAERLLGRFVQRLDDGIAQQLLQKSVHDL